MAGTYVLTTQNTHSEPLINANDTVAVPVDEFVKIFDENPNRYEPKQSKSSPKRRQTASDNRPAWADNNRLMISAIIDPEHYYTEFGGWDNMLTGVGGWVFKNTHGNLQFTADVIDYVNNTGSDPIAFKELTKKFKSWARRWNY